MNPLELLISFEMGLIYGIVAIGIYLTFRIIDFPDLTCDGSFVLGAASSAILIKSGYNPFLALFLAMIAGGIAGLATGILYTKFRITELLSGILVAFMLYSINLRVMSGVPNITLINEPSIFTGQNSLLVLIAIAGFISLGLSALLKTDFGLALRSIGQNKRLALNNGINVKFMTILGLIMSNALIGLGGALFSQHQGFADISQGIGTIIIGLAGLMIGEKMIGFRSLWMVISACLLGSIMYRIFIAFALHSEFLGLETQDLNLITGFMVIGIMLLPKLKRSYA
jgi:putative tryptophan/tyrosine transport system permease protein